MSRATPCLKMLLGAILLVNAALVQGAQEGALPTLHCRGNEPFWSVRLQGEEAVASRMDAYPDGLAFHGSLHPLSYLQPPWWVWRGLAVFNPDDTLLGSLTVTLRAEACEDTMADIPPMDYRAVVVMPDGEVVTGCCAPLSP